MDHKFLIHSLADNVGVAVAEIKAGETVKGIYLEDDSSIDFQAIEDIPLGHKIALSGAPKGTTIIKYNVPIGNAVQDITKGQHVHIHNLKTARW